MPVKTSERMPRGAQQAVEVGVEEGAVARLLDDDVAGLRRQRLHQLVVPAALGQQLALQLGPRAHRLERVRLVPVGRARAARLDIVGVPAVLEEDHRHAGGARGVGRLLDLLDRRRRARDVEAREVEIAAGRGIGVLHVDDDQRRLGRAQHDRLGPRRQAARGRIVDREVADGLGVGHSAAFTIWDDVLAALHQRLDALAEDLGAAHELVEGQQHAGQARERSRARPSCAPPRRRSRTTGRC